MLIPLKYNWRNLRVRWVTTLMTVLATSLVVWTMVLTFGMADGMEHALRISGQPLDILVLRQGAQDEVGSTVSQPVAKDLAAMDGIEKGSDGKPLCAAEFVTILTKPRRNKGGTTNIIVRGVEKTSRSLRPDFKIIAGRDLNPGINEAIVSPNMAVRFENLGLNEKLEINNVPFTIVGYFEAGGSSAESEVWTDIRDLASARRSDEGISSVNLRAVDEQTKRALITRIKEDKQFNLKAIEESKYFEDQMTSAILVKFFSWILSVFLTIGAMFAAANTMFAAVAGRSREIGTLRAMGFHRSAILTSFLLESVFICLLGGLLGCLFTLPFNGLSTGTANWSTFSEMTFSFRFGPAVLLRGVLIALLMGLLGGILPAIRAVRLNIVNALREN